MVRRKSKAKKVMPRLDYGSLVDESDLAEMNPIKRLLGGYRFANKKKLLNFMRLNKLNPYRAKHLIAPNIFVSTIFWKNITRHYIAYNGMLELEGSNIYFLNCRSGSDSGIKTFVAAFRSEGFYSHNFIISRKTHPIVWAQQRLKEGMFRGELVKLVTNMDTAYDVYVSKGYEANTLKIIPPEIEELIIKESSLNDFSFEFADNYIYAYSYGRFYNHNRQYTQRKLDSLLRIFRELDWALRNTGKEDLVNDSIGDI